MTQRIATSDLAQRVREIRVERYGEEGGPLLARELGLPARTWENCEAGVSKPTTVLQRLLDATGVRGSSPTGS